MSPPIASEPAPPTAEPAPPTSQTAPPTAKPAPPTLQMQACDCARLFRLGRDVEAGLNMSALWTAVVPLLNEQTPESMQRWQMLLSQMLARQEAQDWLGLADYLEYELGELIEESGRAA